MPITCAHLLRAAAAQSRCDENEDGWILTYENCWDNGGAAVACLNSNMTFLRLAEFKGNQHRGNDPCAWGYTPKLCVSGGAVHLDKCIWRAHDAMHFYNNSAIGYSRADLYSYSNSTYAYALHGGALSAVNSHASLNGLNLMDNSAAIGDGMYLQSSVLTLSGGRFRCINNAADCDGSCLFVAYGSTVLINSS